MKIAFQADADLDPDIGNGLRRRMPAIDFRDAGAVIPDGTPDMVVLGIAADDGRVLVSRDLHTMARHLRGFLTHRDSPGVILVPSTRSIGEAIERLLFVWQTWTPGDVRNQARWLP